MRFVQRKLYEGRGFKAMLLTLLCRRSLGAFKVTINFVILMFIIVLINF